MRHTGIRQAGSESIDIDAVRSKLLRELLSKSKQSGLCRRVVRIRKVIPKGCAGTDHTDLAMFLSCHIRQHLICEHIGACQICVDESVPLRVCHLVEAHSSPAAGCVVDKDINIAEGFHRFGDCRLNILQLCYVARTEHSISAACKNFLRHTAGAVFLKIAYHNICSEIGKHNCRCSADTVA